VVSEEKKTSKKVTCWETIAKSTKKKGGVEKLEKTTKQKLANNIRTT